MTKKPKLLDFNLDRASARIGILLTACVPLVAIFLTHFFAATPRKTTPKVLAGNGTDNRLIEFCSRNVKSNRAFVLFHHGTCVVVENERNPETIKSQAIQTLKQTATPDARFICTPVEGRNLIVSYTEPVFHLRFDEDMDHHRKEIETDFRRFLTEKELADITPSWEPPFHAKVGLRSRARLLKDASNPVVSRIIAPKSAEKTSIDHTASVSY
ncbi:MAG: hypothetical protein ACSHYB_02120 [Roseibacillus sp.]